MPRKNFGFFAWPFRINQSGPFKKKIFKIRFWEGPFLDSRGYQLWKGRESRRSENFWGVRMIFKLSKSPSIHPEKSAIGFFEHKRPPHVLKWPISEKNFFAKKRGFLPISCWKIEIFEFFFQNSGCFRRVTPFGPKKSKKNFWSLRSNT